MWRVVFLIIMGGATAISVWAWVGTRVGTGAKPVWRYQDSYSQWGFYLYRDVANIRMSFCPECYRVDDHLSTCKLKNAHAHSIGLLASRQFVGFAWITCASLDRRFLFLILPFWFLTLVPLVGTIVVARAPLRSWHRRRRGCCAICAYNLTGNISGVCPECGADIPGTFLPADKTAP